MYNWNEMKKKETLLLDEENPKGSVNPNSLTALLGESPPSASAGR